MGNFENAASNLLRAVNLGKTYSNELIVMLSAEKLSNTYIELGEREKAKEMVILTLAYKDSLFNSESAKSVKFCRNAI